MLVPGVGYLRNTQPRMRKADSTLAHRTLIVRKLKGLEDLISFSVVHYRYVCFVQFDGSLGTFVTWY